LDDISRSREDEWFRRNEEQLVEAARKARQRREEERAAKEAVATRKQLRELHFMKCPKCGHDLREEAFGSVTLDRCSFCEGVFFDAGELEKVLLERDAERSGFLRKLLGV
jgi:hypothetical protein